MKKEIFITGIYSIAHFFVDMLCAATVYSVILKGLIIDSLYIFLTYNFCAFALQLPIGIIADKLNKNGLVSTIGFLLLVLSFIPGINPVVSAGILGLGNALFHIGGGIDVLNIANKKASLPGIYVATGALGLFLGTKYNIKFTKKLIIFIALALAIILNIGYIIIKRVYNVQNEPKKQVKDKSSIVLDKVILSTLFFAVVCVRGYLGLILNYDWKSNAILGYLAIFAVVLGKMLGGVLGDKFGLKGTTFYSLLFSAILFMFSFKVPTLGIIAILLFNMTMPITLICLSNMYPERKGMAFGLTTVALFLGAFPLIMGAEYGLFTSTGLFGMTIFSLVVLYKAIVEYEKVV